MTLAAGTIGAALLGPTEVRAGSAPCVLRTTRRPTLQRVRITVEAEGNVALADNPIASREVTLRMPMKATATLDYEQQLITANTRDLAERNFVAGQLGDIVGTTRHYHEATSRGITGRRSFEHVLGDSVRDIETIRSEMDRLTIARDGLLSAEEAELLDLPVDSTNLEAWLPHDGVVVGDTYSIAEADLLQVLQLDTVDSTSVAGKVTAIQTDQATIEIEGRLSGSVRGVLTDMRLVGKMNYNRVEGLCDWLAIAIHETRGVGLAGPGLDVSATVKMIRRSMKRPVKLATLSPSQQNAWVSDHVPTVDPTRTWLRHRSRHLDFEVLMSRDWRLMSDVPGAAMMRMVRDDRSIAQCDVKRLPDLPAGSQLTLAAFSDDVRQTLGDQLDQLDSADQRISAGGLRVLRVSAAGQASGVPIRWLVLHLSNDQGRRLLATFTMQANQRPTFGAADEQWADSLTLLDGIGRNESTQTASHRETSNPVGDQLQYEPIRAASASAHTRSASAPPAATASPSDRR